MADLKTDAWAREAVRRAVRSAARALVAKLDREARDLARWLQKTNDLETPLGERKASEWKKPDDS